MRALLICSAWLATSSPAQRSEPPVDSKMRDSATLAAADRSRAERRFESGLQLAADNQIDAAITVFTELTRDYPRLPEPYQQLAALRVKRGDLQRAVTALQTAVKLGVQDTRLQEQLGDLYVELAADAYRQALKADAPSASLRNKYSIIQSVNPPPVPPGRRPP